MTRRKLPWVASLALLAFLLVACQRIGQSDSARKPSCVAPFIRSDATRTPPGPGRPTTFGRVRPGQRLTVHGWWYYKRPCDSTPVNVVQLSLRSMDHGTALLTTAAPTGGDAAFIASVDRHRCVG